MNAEQIKRIIDLLRQATRHMMPPLVDTIIKEYGHDPYLILISCLLSLRAQDRTTIHACRKLFAVARTPNQLIALLRQDLEKLIFTTGFYKIKARVLQEVSYTLLEKYAGRVPASLEELLAIKGIGRKTANLVLGLAYDKPSICVDTHVHRISNRLGLIKTAMPEKTEQALQGVLPEKYWIEWNKLLVMWGQNICVPLSPKCSQCAIRSHCKRVGVTRSR